MAGKSSGFSISFGIQDNASAGIDAITKRIQAMQAPAERFNKSLAKFADVSGINRAAEGIQSLGDRALEGARSVERMAGGMAGITSAASIGGMIELSRRWAEAGNQISRTSSQLNTPVSQLSALRGAARLAGLSAETMDSSLKGLGDALADAQNHGGPLVALLDQFHIKLPKVGEAARTGADAIKEILDAAATYKDPHAQQEFLKQFGISPDMIAFIDKNKSLLEEKLKQAQQSGGLMTAEMAANAKKMDEAWARLGLNLEGIFNSIADRHSGMITKMLGDMSHFIEERRKLGPEFDDTVERVGKAVAAVGAIRAAPWVLRALKWLLPGETLATGAMALPLLATGPAGGNPEGFDAWAAERERDRVARGDYGVIGNWWVRTMPSWLGGGDPNYAPGPAGPLGPLQPWQRAPRRLPGPRADAGNALDPETVARAKLVHDGLVKRGMDSNTAWGFAGNAVQESRADPHSRPGDMGAAHGLFMWRDSDDGGHRYSDYVARYGHAPEQGSLDEQLDNVMAELAGSERGAWRNIQRAGDSPGEKAAAVSTFYERPKDTADEESRRWGIASRLAAMAAGDSGMTPAGGNGTVRVDVHLHGANPGTTATATGTGAVMVTPPNIQTSMPFAH